MRAIAEPPDTLLRCTVLPNQTARPATTFTLVLNARTVINTFTLEHTHTRTERS